MQQYKSVYYARHCQVKTTTFNTTQHFLEGRHGQLVCSCDAKLSAVR